MRDISPIDVEPILAELQGAVNVQHLMPIIMSVDDLDFAAAKREIIKLCSALAIDQEVKT